MKLALPKVLGDVKIKAEFPLQILHAIVAEDLIHNMFLQVFFLISFRNYLYNLHWLSWTSWLSFFVGSLDNLKIAGPNPTILYVSHHICFFKHFLILPIFVFLVGIFLHQ